MKKELKDLDRNELIIKWGDIIILNSNHLGEVSKESFMLDWVFDATPPTPEQVIMVQNDPARKIRDEFLRRLKAAKSFNLDLIGKELESNLTGVKNHLLSHGYIEIPDLTDRFWRISDKGKLMKELGGHFAYQKYRRSEINIIRNQGKVNGLLILATALAAIMPFMAIWLFPPKVDVKVPEQVFRPDIRIDSVWLHQQVDDLIQKRLSSPTPKAATLNPPTK